MSFRRDPDNRHTHILSGTTPHWIVVRNLSVKIRVLPDRSALQIDVCPSYSTEQRLQSVRVPFADEPHDSD